MKLTPRRDIIQDLKLNEHGDPSCLFKILRATACKYGESDERSENSRFLLLPQKDSWRAIFRNTLTVPESSHFCEIKESSTATPLNQQQR